MSLHLSPSSLFTVEEADNSDCEHSCDKFDRRLQVELRNCGKNCAEMPAAAASAPPQQQQQQVKKKKKKEKEKEDTGWRVLRCCRHGCPSCLPDLIIDCTCLDRRPKPTRLYYCCCLNLRCSAHACRTLLFVLAFSVLASGVAAAAAVTVWGVVVGREEARNLGIAGFAAGLLLLIYACCVASQCQAGRKTRELRELAQLQQLAQARERQRLASRLSTASLRPEDVQQLQQLHQQQQQQKQQQRKQKQKGAPKKKKKLPEQTARPGVGGGGSEQALVELGVAKV